MSNWNIPYVWIGDGAKYAPNPCRALGVSPIAESAMTFGDWNRAIP